MNVSSTDIYPRINKETQKIKSLEKKTKDKNEKKRLKEERENIFKTTTEGKQKINRR